MTDPFAAPAVIPSTYPSVQSFHGRLVLISPKKTDQVPNLQNPGQMVDRITADVTVVDGQGAVPLYKQRVQTGQFLEGPDFPGTYFNGSRMTKQLFPSIPAGMVLARIGLYKEGQPAGQGNPWGLVDPTEEDKQIARNFLANRTIGAVQAPAAAPMSMQGVPHPPNVTPQYAAQAPAQQYAPPVQPAPAPGFNPFAQPAASAPPAGSGNPFA